MNSFVRAVAIFFMILLAFPAVRAEAADSSGEETAQEMMSTATGKDSHPWSADIGQTWLPDSDVRDTGGKVEMRETEVRFSRKYEISPAISLSTGLAYSLRDLDGPASARLPDKLHTASVEIGGNIGISKNLFLDVMVSPGLNGDFKKIDGDSVRTQVGFMGRYNLSEKLTLLAGLVYQQGYKSYPVVPVLGFIYKPNGHWTMGLAAPRPGISYSPDKKSNYYLGGEFTATEYELHDPSIGAKIIEYRDFRVVAGAEYTVFSAVRIGISGGYAFSRKFRFYDGPRSDVRVDNNGFVRLSAGVVW